MFAIISDIHSNIEALQAVLDDILSRDIKDIICLGDLVGYGANPRECVDLIQRHATVCLRGNHDDAVLTKGTRDFNIRAESALMWTRDQLFSGAQLARDRQRRIRFLRNLPLTHEDGDSVFVHGSPRMPLKDYVFPRDVRNKAKMQEIFGAVKRFCFCGHTHVPGVFTPAGRYTHPEELLGGIYMPESPKVLVNVGSVGQPRDSDRRACYCIFNGESVVFRRVPYDTQAAAEKIYLVEDLDNSLADRLIAGK